LSDPKLQADAAPEPTPPDNQGKVVLLMRRFLAFIGRLRAWTGGNRKRGIAVASTILVLILATIGGWAYLASIAIHSGQQSVSAALEALDQQRYEEARAIVGNILRSGHLPRSEYGGPLFVLGAIKTHDAEISPSPERRRVEYLVASRYLKEARSYGIPSQREIEGLSLLGLSLIKSTQFDEGIRVLDELLADKLATDEPLTQKVHRLLAETCLHMPRPQLEKALQHNSAVLADPDLSAEDRAGALLQEADCLARLDRFDDARKTLGQVPDVENRRAAVLLLQGRITLDELDAALQKVATTDRGQVITEWKPKTDEAIRELQEAEKLDGESGFVSRQASYQLGRAWELQGDSDAALHQFTHTRQQYPESQEGMAANLGEADLLRQKGDVPAALLGYRRVLEPFTGAANYRSDVLPLDQVRARVFAAVSDFVDHHHFAEALVLLGRFTPMFSRTEQLEIQGDTLQQWGNLELGRSSEEGEQDSDERQTALHHLRAAGLAFEQLAELRFATNSYTQDLWKSAENYYRGHSFSSTIRQLNKYLKNEPELRNAPALLRLGQAHLALGQVAECIAALAECIEFHPLDGSTYQARIDCAKAYWNQGNTQRAEQLLRDNITGSTLKPSSREWKDSLFELGMLLHETNHNEQAIGTLEEAVERYPDDPQTLLAQYVIGESYRRWAEELLERVRDSRTSGERDKNQQLAGTRLITALQHFEEVQRNITLRAHDVHSDPLMGTMLRNCYMLEGTVLFDLGRYKEAIEAYSNVSSLYPDEPFVLETFVQIANCWRRLDQSEKARGAIRQAQIALDRLPAKAEFTNDTAFTRDEWRMLLADMSKW
jgi:TolA-binding protein